MRLFQFISALLIWLLSSGSNIWAEAIQFQVDSTDSTIFTASGSGNKTMQFQEYNRYPVLGTICAQLKEQSNDHAYKMPCVDSTKNSYYFDIKGVEGVEKARLYIDNIVSYSRYPVNPVNGMDNFRKYLRFLSHSLYIGRPPTENNFKFELIRTYPRDLYEFIYRITDTDIDANGTYNTSSISIYICNLSEIQVGNNTPMKDRQATLALYLDHGNRLIGYDFLGSEELQRKELQRKEPDRSKYGKNKNKDWSWQNHIYLPIDIMICAKQTAGELVKAPLHLVGIPIVNFMLNNIEASDKPLNKIGDALKLGGKTFKEDIYEIKYIWLYRLTKLNHNHKLKHFPLNFILEPIREIPLVGDHIPRDTHYSSGTQTPKYLFISRGIYGRSSTEQDTKNWEQFMKNILIEDVKTKSNAANEELRANTDSVELQVSSIPYQYGSILDVLWSLLNISSGSGYEMAYRIVNEYEIGQGDVIFLTGHSGGVQRCMVAEKLLLENQIRTQRRAGLAGPSQGIVYCSKKKNNQNYITFLNQNRDYADIVSNLNTILDITPPMCLPNWIWKRNEEKIRIADPTLRHITPGVINPETRIPASGYLGKEYINFFSNSYVGEQLAKPEKDQQRRNMWKIFQKK